MVIVTVTVIVVAIVIAIVIVIVIVLTTFQGAPSMSLKTVKMANTSARA